jgi:hypothetical protein
MAPSTPAEMAQVAVTIQKDVAHAPAAAIHRNISDDKSEVFSRADRDGDGQLSKEEFKEVTAVMTQEHITQVKKQSRVNRRALFISLALFSLLVLSIVGNTAGSLWIVSTQVKTTVGGSDDSIMRPKSDPNSIVKTAPPMQEGIPLGLASHLDHEGLMSIKRVVVRKQVYNESDLAPDAEEQEPKEVYSAYTVVGYDWTSSSQMQFSLHDGSTVFIEDGNTWLFDATEELPCSICKTEMESAMFLVGGIDVDALMASMPSRHRARALAQATNGCSDRAYIDKAIEVAFVTGPEAETELSELSEDVDAALNDNVDDELTDAEALATLEATVNGSEIITDIQSDGRQLGTWGRVSGLSAKVRAKYTKANGKRSLVQKAHLLAYKATVKHFTASNGNPNEFHVPDLPEGSPCQPLYSEVNSFLDGMEAITDSMDAAQVVIHDTSTCLSAAGAPLGYTLKVFSGAFKALDILTRVLSKLPYIGGLFKVISKGMNIAYVQFKKLADKHRDWKRKRLEPVQDVVLDMMIANAIYAEKMYLSYRMIDVLVSQAIIVGETSCPNEVEESGVCRDLGATEAVAAMNRAFPTEAVFDGIASGFKAVHDKATFACGWLEDKAIKNVLYLLEKSGIIDVLTKLKNWITKKHCVRFLGKHCFKLTKVPKIVKKVVNGMVDKIIKLLKIDKLIKKMVGQLLGPLKLDKLLAAMPDGFPSVPEYLPEWKGFEENMGIRCLTNRAETQAVSNAAEQYASSSTGMPGVACLAPPFDKVAELSCEADR